MMEGASEISGYVAAYEMPYLEKVHSEPHDCLGGTRANRDPRLDPTAIVKYATARGSYHLASIQILPSRTKAFFMLRSHTFLSHALRRFSSRLNPIMNTRTHQLPANTLLDEEGNPDYDPRRFYPARIGDTIQKYQIISKLGWGTGSTVWLAKDTKWFVQRSS